MGKKKSDEGSTKAKQGGKEKLSVSALLASMDAKPDKPKKAASSKPKTKVAQKVSSYTDGIDLPSSDEEEDVLDSEEEQKQNDIQKKQGRQNRSAATLDIIVSDKELKKREKKDFFATQAAELAKQEALKDDRDAFTVVIGSRASVLDGGDDADANVKDITIDNFSVSARGKELLKNASVKISHGKRYGLVGPNGMGKSTLLKLLAWRKIPVPKNIDVLLVEQEVVGDDRSALEAVVSANEELIKLRQDLLKTSWRLVLILPKFNYYVVTYRQQEKVKDRAKFAAAKEAAKNKGKGKVDEDDTLPEAPQKWRDYTVEFHFPEPTELTPPLLQLIEVSFSYPGRNDFRLSNVDVGIDMGTRVAIVGPNGAGKSTLLNLLAGDIVPTEGEVRKSQKLRIGRYSQHFVDLLTMDETPVQYLLRLHPDQEGLSKQEAVRAKLGKYGLPSHNHLTPIAKLSGGQKARVVFTSISMSKPHILLLDEPTNHLDMQSIDALADALDEFTGGVVLVSHDSRLISRVCEDEEKSEIWVVENGTVEAFPGSFEDYKEELIKEIRAEVDD
ncbi:ABC transporter F family member 4-like [Sesamum indicum]|uniref:ABC transporter F family member 4-like n=1 Tax=Sesamum indicum TaxID=4182 RepID=A0A6I9SNZ1_SESIN|nr:ABC transporter F family member 4-like [Sesamum indicum]